MVEVTTKVQTATEKIKLRQANIKVPGTRPGIMVEPADDNMRKLLKHPRGIKFRSEGPIEWPDDQFTHRRIRDGSVKVVEQKNEQHEPAHRRPLHQRRDE